MRENGTALPRFSKARDVDIAVIVVSYNTAHLLERCIGALRSASAGLSVSLVIVDNASRDDSVALVKTRIEDCTLIENTVNVGFGRANNQALAHCGGHHVLLLNADAYVFPDTLRQSLAHLNAHAKCGVLGVQSISERGQPEFAGRTFPTAWQNFVQQTGLFCRSLPPVHQEHTTSESAIECDWVVGCYYMVRREVIDKVGLFDPRYFLYFEEVDHCRAVKAAGWKTECLLNAHVIHEGGGSASSEGRLGDGRQIVALQVESSLLYFRKHDGLSGLFLALMLSILAEAVLALKGLLKGRPANDLVVHWRSVLLLGKLAVRTRLGTRPTR